MGSCRSGHSGESCCKCWRLFVVAALAQPTPNCPGSLLCNSLLAASGSGPAGRSLALGHGAELCTTVFVRVMLSLFFAKITRCHVKNDSLHRNKRQQDVVRDAFSSCSPNKNYISSQPPGKLVPGFERQCNVFEGLSPIFSCSYCCHCSFLA